MSDKKRIMMVVLVAFVIVLVAILVPIINKANKNGLYSVVYLTTGEVYVGRLTTFPDLRLTDGYILQVAKDTVDPTKSNFQLNPINQALWAPEVMHINRQNVVFYGPLLSTSKIAETLAAKQ